MHEEIIIAGFGAQGILFAGQLLEKAAVIEGRHVKWLPPYWPEVRGAANCTLAISDEPIDIHPQRRPTILIALSDLALQRFASDIQSGGYILIDSSVVSRHVTSATVHQIALPASGMAEKLDYPRIAIVVLIGALVGATGLVQLRSVEEALAELFAPTHPELIAASKHALHMGAVLQTDSMPVLEAAY